jgi:sulfur-carrier protein
MAKVLLPPAFQKFTEGTMEIQIDRNQIFQIIIELENKFPKLREKMLIDDMRLQRFIKIFVNGEDISRLNGLDTKINEVDRVKIVLALAGG